MSTNAWLAIIVVLLATLVFGPWVLALVAAVGIIILTANAIEAAANKRKDSRWRRR